ncbi:MAG: hypothetical protein AB7S41_02500 [Parvibaculaceae bacterium]
MTIHPIQLIDAKARQSLFAFVWRCYLELHPGFDQRFIPNWHVEAICHTLERVAANDCRRLLITAESIALVIIRR